MNSIMNFFLDSFKILVHSVFGRTVVGKSRDDGGVEEQGEQIVIDWCLGKASRAGGNSIIRLHKIRAKLILIYLSGSMQNHHGKHKLFRVRNNVRLFFFLLTWGIQNFIRKWMGFKEIIVFCKLTWSDTVKKWQNLIFKVKFLCYKPTKSLIFFFHLQLHHPWINKQSIKVTFLFFCFNFLSTMSPKDEKTKITFVL